MSSKKTDSFTVHCDAERKLQFQRLANMRGVSLSELALETMERLLSQEMDRYMKLQEVFEGERSMGSGGPPRGAVRGALKFSAEQGYEVEEFTEDA